MRKRRIETYVLKGKNFVREDEFVTESELANYQDEVESEREIEDSKSSSAR